MKQIDLAKLTRGKEAGSGLQKVQGALQDALSRVGITLEGEGEARQTILRQFDRTLDNRYTMLENAQLPGQAVPIPLILIGPPGIVVINPRGEAGVFRAREDSWVEMNRRTQQYEMARENLLVQTQEYAQALEAALRAKGAQVTEVQPLLALSNPGAHVESSRPIVRILPIDALDRYIATLAQGQYVLSAPDVQALVETFTTQPEAPKPPEPEVKPKPQKAAPPLSAQLNLPPLLANFKLTRPQWIVLGVMVFGEVLLLVALIVFVVLNA